ncbi:Uncharacterised protein [Klebsiella pneumoniae]|nr:Uncharacterised protein [Klebsiella pneumoniae]
MHFAAGRNAVALTNRNGQGAKHQPGGLFRQRIGKIGGLRRDPCLQGVGQRVQPGMGCDGGRYANHQRRVDDRHVGTERLMEQRVLDPFFRVADDAGAGHFRTGTAGGGDRHAGVDRQTALLAEPDDSLGGIHRRAAAEADHHLRTQGLHLRYPFRHGVNGRIRCNIAEHADAVAGGQRGAQSVKQRRARQEAVADDPDVLMAKALQRGQAARAAVEARLQRKGMHGAPG